MTGFFDLSEVVTTSSDYMCPDCQLYKTCKSPKMNPTGEGGLKTLIVAEASGKDEDNRGKQLVGEVGQFFRGLLSSRGFDLDADFWKTNALSCRPPENREPTSKEIACCRPRVEKTVKDNKPKFIFLLGGSAIESFFGGSFSDVSPTRWRNTCIPDHKNNVWILPMFHPSYALRNEDNPLIMSQYIRDLEFALNCIKTKGPVNEYPVPDMDCVTVMTNFDTICDSLENLIDNPPEILAFDYETTGLKPYRNGHKIVSVSFCSELDKAYSFPLQHKFWDKTPLQRVHLERLWGQVLKNDSKKVAQGMKFEDVWSRIALGKNVYNWFWCTEITAHILDNRSKFAGLKFQSFINWGVPNYSKEIKPFLETTDERGFNRVEQAPLNKLLLYGGQDSLLTYWLFKKQSIEVDPHLLKGVDLFTDGSLTLADMQINGINVDGPYYKAAHIELEKRIKQRLLELLEYDECKEYEKQKGHPPNLGSSDDLREMFFEVLKLKPPKTTDKGNFSVDAESLAKLDTPLAKEITELNKIKKVDGTYLSQFLREIDDDGRIRPFFDISQVKTYRGASSRPNFQNIPVRNEEAKRYSRSGIIPSKGWRLLDFDFMGIEVSMGGCYTKDPVLISYIKDPTTDMHRDTAADIFALKNAPAKFWKEPKTGKKLRFYAKNGFVFPEWYGSYYINCAKNIWNTCANLRTHEDITILEHLRAKGIIENKNKPLDDFIKHVKEVEEAYWRKFKVFKRWQEGMYRKFEETGIVELFTGFRCKGYLGRNEIVNYSFQGTAFHCLLWSLIQINAELAERKMESKVIAQIHDNGILDCPPDECGEVQALCTEIATQRIKQEFPWLIVPLSIEWETTVADGSWYSKKEDD